jgi:hypothetical protein
MGLALHWLWETACVSTRNRCAAVCLVALVCGAAIPGQVPDHKVSARRFLAGRTGAERESAAGLAKARRQHAAMLARPQTSGASAGGTPLSAAWQAVGPGQIASLNYGNVTGRVTSVAIDPADVTGNTVYLGTTGGGVWKSTNADRAAASVTFAPLTDDLGVFNGGGATASLSIGAVSVSDGVVLAGTGDPNDALDSYYGSGILRSADGGTTWTLAQQSNDGATGVHLFTGLGFAGFAWSGATPMTVVAAVSDAAEGELVGAVNDEYSTRGLYVSNDAGVTWQMATVMDGTQVVQSPQPNGLNNGGSAATAVVWNPVRQRFYAAVRFHGYYESTDGTVWTRLAAQPGTGLTTAACPSNTNKAGSVHCPIFRGALAVEPVSGDMYAFTVDAGLVDQGIWRDVCAANGGVCASPVAFGTKLDATPLEAGFGSTAVVQGDYDLSLATVASGAQTFLFAGTVDLYRCSLTTAQAGAAGCEFRNTTNVFNGCAAPAMVASAQHAIAVLAGEGPLVYLGNDGGVWRSTDGVAETGTPCSASDAGHFQDLNGGLGSLAEVVGFAQDPTDAGTLLVGVGANGTAATSAAGQGIPWAQLAAGEGGFAAIDQIQPQNWYVSTGPGVNIDYCGNGALCGAAEFADLPTIGEAQVDEDASVIDAPWTLDPGDTANVVIGTCRVWRGPGAAAGSWPGGNAISAEFGGSSEDSCGAGDSFVRSLAAGGALSAIASGPNAGSKVIYAGMAGVLDGGGSLGGHVFSTTVADKATGTTAWTDLALNPVTNDAANGGVFNPAGFDVSSVAVDPHDATGATVYATVMGFGGNGLVVPHVYRSVDGGAHWLNISSNLPDVPANGVVVDPNDAATVYVAMDTGVYATTAVSGCATGDCWAVFGAGLPNAPVVALQAAAAIPDGLGNAGELRAGTYGRGIWEVPLLSAMPATTAAVGLTPGPLTFAEEALGTISAAQTETVTNTGSAAAVVSAASATGDFAETDNCVGVTLSVGASCAVQVTFAATVVGTRAGTLTVAYEKAGQATQLQATTTLSGTGETAAAVALDPLALNFGSVVMGTTSPTQSVTLTNMGGVAATLATPTMTGDFGIAANGCTGTLAPGTQCSVGIAFAPTATGTRNGTFSVAASNGMQTASLTGVGASVAADTVSPGALNFGQQQENTTSAAETVTLKNSGDTALTGISAAISGAGFALTNSCGGTLAGHSACSMTVTFTPGSVGTLTGTVTVTDELRSQTVLLSGVGYPPPVESVTPGSLSFAATAVGTASPVQQVAVSNTGGGVLALGAVTVTGDFTETDSCAGGRLGGAVHCAVNVVFTPTAVGTRTGTLTVAGTSPGTGVTVPLTGIGATVAAIGVSPGNIGFGAVTIGAQSGTQTVTVSNTGGLTGTLGTAAVTGDFQIQSNFCGGLLAAGSQCLVGVVFAPTASGTRTGTFTVPGPTGLLSATLTGTGAAAATDTLSPGILTFGPQQVGTASAAQTVTVTNSGDGTLTGLQANVSPRSFTLANGCGTSLAGHSQCTLTVTFDPLAAGPIAGNLMVQDQSRAQPQVVGLSGTGLAPAQIVLTPTGLSFASAVVGTTTAAQNVTVSNTGGVAATLDAPTVIGEFPITANTCGASLAPGTGCTVAVAFSPAKAGVRNGRLSIAGSVGTQTAGLTGTGLAPATDGLSPLALSFGQQIYGTTSAAQTVTLTNKGDAALTPIAAAIESGTFDVVNNCGGTLAGHSSCTMLVTFSPLVAGPMAGVLTVSDALQTQSVALSGAGIGPPLLLVKPVALGFAATAVGQTSSAQTVTVSNGGGGTLTLGKMISVTGDFTETDNCGGAALATGANCTVQVVFSPTATGTRTGTLAVTGSAGAGTTTQSVTVALSGAGASPAAIVLTPTSVDFGSLTVGATSPVQNITISNTGGVPATLGATAVTGDFAITANTCGATLAAETGCTVAIAFTPTVSGTRAGVFSIAASAGTQSLNQTAALTGVGTSVATDALSPLALSFSPQQYGTSSAAQTLTLTNTGDQALTLISATLSAGVANDNFAVANNCGMSLAGHSSCTLAVVFTPIAGGTLTGTLTVSDALRTQTVSLNGVSVAPPLAGLSPTAVSFAATAVGQMSAAQTLTVTNTGGGNLVLSSASATSGFAETENCTTVALTAGASCSVQIVFSPTATGPQTGTLTLKGNMPDGLAMVSLSGVGAAPAAIVLTPVSLNFGTVTVGSSADPALNIAVSNTGGVPATLGAAMVTGDFSMTANTCGTTLAASTGCTVAIGFTPTTAGTRTGVFSIAASSGTQGLNQTAALSGTGAAAATDGLSPLALGFAPQTIGTTSAAQTVTLTNMGDNTLTLVAAQIASGDFVASSACGNALIGHASCTIAVSYAPKMVGQETGVLTVSDQFKSQTVALSGTGTAAPGFSITPTSLTFAPLGVGQTSAGQTLTVSNNGLAALTISGVTANGDFTLPAAGNTCGTMVAAGGSCTVQVEFAPTVGGTRQGTVSFADNAAGSPQAVAISGVGVDFSLAADGPTSATVASGASASYALLLSSAAGTPGTATFVCTGIPANSVCTVTPGTPALGTSTLMTVTVETAVSATGALRGSERSAWWAAALFGLGLVGRRKRYRWRGMVLLALLMTVGCGAGRVVPPPYTGPGSGGGGGVTTPSGTYTISVAASSAGLTRTEALTLVVQ